MVQSNLIKVGVFGSPVGLKGEAKIKILTSSFDFFKKLNDYCDSEESVYWTFEKVRLKNKNLVAHPNNCHDRNDAEKLKGKIIFTHKKNFPKTKKGEFYINELIGFDIYHLNGKKIGSLINIENFGAGDLLELKTSTKSVYIPMNKENLVSINVSKKKIIVNPIKGIIN